MTTQTVKVGDTIRTAKPMNFGSLTARAGEHLQVSIETPDAAEYATKLVAAGTWIVLSNNNEKETADEQA